MDFSIKIDPRTWKKYMAVRLRGRAILNNPFTNKGPAFTARERDELDLHGLLPAAISTIEDQLLRNYENFNAQPNHMGKYNFLSSLQDRNETLFFRFLHEYIDETMPIVYTPTVGEACQKFSHIYRRARGIYVSYGQKDNIKKILRNFYFKDPSVIVVTDGERILGLGDQGADGMGIPIGKLCLYTLCAGVSPYSTLPVMLDVGTDNEERRNDPLYLGLRRERIRGEEYQAFVDQFVYSAIEVFPNALLHWEDFLKANAIKQLDRFKDVLCTFNDDIQGTGSVVVGFIFRALGASSQSILDSRFIIAGAGAAANGIANLIAMALQEQGLSSAEARGRIWMVDSQGLVTKRRQGLPEFKEIYAKTPDEVSNYECRDLARITLEEAVKNVRPNVLIGTSATPGIFTETIVKTMAEISKHPIIFPLSNPASKSECSPEEAIRWSNGRAIVATGSPFPPVEYNGRLYRTGQCNNAFVFPGLGLGVTVGEVRRVTDAMLLSAAKAIAEKDPCGDLNGGPVFPELNRIREYSHAVACAVIRTAVSEGNAEEGVLFKLDEAVRNAMWFPEYLPTRYEEGDSGWS
ncbi:MAG: NAD-dependent malic enzyme [Pseudomonadota bacterium]